ncbi:MAG: nucleoside hydrolase [Candidatus Aenigmarchaeota archaeon]|nr:nucleoside hydrolase [Candidatus Aenigmarchaeota archaeon]
MEKMLIDVDTGVDDALALLYLGKCGKCEIEAVTTVCGNATVANTTKNTKYVLGLLEAQAPVYSGAARPLAKELYTAKSHGHAGLGNIEGVPEACLDGLAEYKIGAAVSSNAGITILALAPLTNIALALGRYGEQMAGARYVIMGGAVRDGGNVTEYAEFNFYVDPDAAAKVLASGLDITLVPLDVCRKLVLTRRQLDSLPETTEVKAMKAMLEPYLADYEPAFGGAVLYDPLAAMIALDQKEAKTEGMCIQVETTGGRRGSCTPTAGEVKVVTEIDEEYYLREFLRVFA